MPDPTTNGTPSLAPVGRTRNALAAEVYDNLLDALMDGRLSPGDRLVMDRLADDLGVSRSPVRDALLRLHREATLCCGCTARGSWSRAGSAATSCAPPPTVTSTTSTPHGWQLRVSPQSSYKVPEQMHGCFFATCSKACPPRRRRPSASRSRPTDCSTGESSRSPETRISSTCSTRFGIALTYRDFAAAYPYDEFVPEHTELLDALERARPKTARNLMVQHITGGLDRTRLDRTRPGSSE